MIRFENVRKYGWKTKEHGRDRIFWINADHVDTFDVSLNFPGINDDEIASIARHYPKLQNISIVQCIVRRNQLQQIRALFPMLKEITLEWSLGGDLTFGIERQFVAESGHLERITYCYERNLMAHRDIASIFPTQWTFSHETSMKSRVCVSYVKEK